FKFKFFSMSLKSLRTNIFIFKNLKKNQRLNYRLKIFPSERSKKCKKWGAKSSSSAVKWLTIHQYDNLEECMSALRGRYKTILTTHLSSDAVSLHAIDFTQSIALVFGNEHSGVSDEMRAAADGNFIIPQVGIIRSLNISVACAVTLYEAFRQKRNAGQYDEQRLGQEQYDTLMNEWRGWSASSESEAGSREWGEEQ
ncbi:MAG: hypothetical protein EOO01_36075, partial [Chitinophagaceae bacterium]